MSGPPFFAAHTVRMDMAGVTCLCHLYVDLLHLLRMPEGWRIVNAVWGMR
ncbi:MAG: nuclear transport factor 2 family protein [Solirubrobacterales bacterium]